MNRGFWSGRKVFVTGHTGFKGSWLCLWLYHLGAKVGGYSLDPSTTPSLFDEASIGNLVDSFIGDIRDAHHIYEAMAAFSPEVVIHMAAQPLVRGSYIDPVGTYSTNVMGTVNLFEAVRRTPSVKAVVNVTTDKCYENREWCWGYRETDPLGGFDPYSSSKAASEIVTSAYRSSFFNPDAEGSAPAIASVRAGNVIGGGDWSPDRLIPDLLASFRVGEPALIRSPDAIRPWQHVLEALRGYLMLSEKLLLDGPAFGEAWNFGPDDLDARPVSWVADQLCSRWGGGAQWEQEQCLQPHEATYLKLDTSKARARLNWRQAIDLSVAIELIVDWVQSYDQGCDVREKTIGQIEWYQKLLER